MHAFTVLCLLLAAARTFAAQAVDEVFVRTAKDIDIVNSTVRLPLYTAKLANGATVFHIVTEASNPAAAKAWGGVSLSAPLATLNGTKYVQQAKPDKPGAAVTPASLLVVPAGVNFAYGSRSLVPNPSTGFPPLNFSYSAQGSPGYSPLLQLPDGTILNAPQVARQLPNGTLLTHPKVLAIAPDRRSVVFALTHGFSGGKPIVYISTEASDKLAATLENVPYVPLLADVPESALIGLVAFTNGQTGAANPQRQGLASAIKDGLSPLNVVSRVPSSPLYSPLWDVVLATWVGGKPGARQTSVPEIKALGATGKLASFSPGGTSAPPLVPAGIIVNCPIIASVKDGAAASKAVSG